MHSAELELDLLFWSRDHFGIRKQIIGHFNFRKNCAKLFLELRWKWICPHLYWLIYFCSFACKHKSNKCACSLSSRSICFHMNEWCSFCSNEDIAIVWVHIHLKKCAEWARSFGDLARVDLRDGLMTPRHLWCVWPGPFIFRNLFLSRRFWVNLESITSGWWIYCTRWMDRLMMLLLCWRPDIFDVSGLGRSL